MRVPLAYNIESRSASTAKDARVVNAYIDTEGQIRRVIKRPGLASFTVTPALAAASAQGMYPFKATGKLYPIVSNTLYEVTTAGASTSKGAVTAGLYSYTETSDFAYLFFHNGTDAYYLDSPTATLTHITDVNFPTNQTPAFTLAPGAVYLDDTVYVMTTTGRIYNSGVETVANGTWNSLNYVTKSSEPDGGVAICKHLSYLVAFGQWSGEFFYDAANPTGSPLARNDTAKMEVGCANGQSLVQFLTNQTSLWVGQARETGRGVYKLDGLAPKKISTKVIDSYLNADSLTNVRAWAIMVEGHPMYVLTLKDSGYTFIYDLHESMWYQWTSDNGAGVESFFTQEFFSSIGGVSYLLGGSTGLISKMNNTTYQDLGVSINFRVVTPRFDGGTIKNKFHRNLTVIGDTFTSAGTISIKHSEDDYVTWSTYRTVDMTQKKPVIWQLGYFKRRAFDVWSTTNLPIRLEALESEVEGGID